MECVGSASDFLLCFYRSVGMLYDKSNDTRKKIDYQEIFFSYFYKKEKFIDRMKL